MHIKHYTHDKINFKKWDKCISESKNGLIYAYSWFLNVVSPGWEALISDDFQYVMPLPVKKKYGIKYIVQPVLTQQLGVFSAKEIESSLIDSFINAIPYFSYEMNLNEQNFTSDAEEKLNLTLDLQSSLKEIEANFSENTKRNINKAISNKVKLDWKLSADHFLDFYFQASVSYSKPNELITRDLIRECINNHSAKLIAACNHDSEIISALCLLRSGNRLIYILPVSNDQGKKVSAMFLIVSEIIIKYAGSNQILDFEGSMIEGIARFYRGFGSVEKPYYVIKRFRPAMLKGKI